MALEELKELLKEHLTISVWESKKYSETSINVSIEFDGEEICSSEEIIGNGYGFSEEE